MNYLAEAGVAYTDTVQNNINLILNFAFLVRLSLKKILKNSFELRIGVHCGSVVSGLVHTSTLVPSFCLCGDTVNVVKQLESQCLLDQIYITDSVKNHSNSTLNCTETGMIEFDVTRGITSAKGLLKTYVFDSFKRQKNFEGLVAQIESEFKKVMPKIIINDEFNFKAESLKRRDSSTGFYSDISEVTFSDF